MKISQLAQQLAKPHDRSVIATIQSLLFLMKKFGKALNTQSVLSVLNNSCPEVVKLYSLLWMSRCTINQCQVLLVSVSRLLEYNHLQVTSFIDSWIELSKDDIMDELISSVVGFSVIGKWKIYKRTLDGDLRKFIVNNC